MKSPVVHRFTVETTTDGYGALESRGDDLIFTSGATLDELFEKIREALTLYYDEAEEPVTFEVELVGLQPA